MNNMQVDAVALDLFNSADRQTDRQTDLTTVTFARACANYGNLQNLKVRNSEPPAEQQYKLHDDSEMIIFVVACSMTTMFIC